MIVREIQVGEEARWDEYVRNHPLSTPQHIFAWKKVMEDVFESETHYILSQENGHITGVLPLIHIKSLLAGHYVTSLPGGICADSEEASCLLFGYAREFVETQNAKYLILRDGRRRWDLPGLLTDEEHVTFLIQIHPDPEKQKQNMKAKTRQLVNKVSNNGLKAVVGLEYLTEYYPIFTRSMQELGTPTLGLNFFRSTAQHFQNDIDLIAIHYSDKVVGGGFIAPMKQTVFCLWSGLLHDYYRLHIAYLLSWTAIKYAHQKGFQWVDLGRCRKNSGSYEFKCRFGGEIQPLYQQVYLNGIEKAPTVGAEMREDKMYRAFVNIWRRLPMQMTEILGPMLRKQMPFG